MVFMGFTILVNCFRCPRAGMGWNVSANILSVWSIAFWTSQTTPRGPNQFPRAMILRFTRSWPGVCGAPSRWSLHPDGPNVFKVAAARFGTHLPRCCQKRRCWMPPLHRSNIQVQEPIWTTRHLFNWRSEALSYKISRKVRIDWQ